MELATTTGFTTDNPPVTKADVDNHDTSLIAGVVAAVCITVLVGLTLIAIYLYKHKGSYRTHEMMEEGEAEAEEEAAKALQEKTDPSEEKPEYLM
ncbi:small cell adhesion glycoprotein isoform 1-T4 [Mantella aurantiaca]